MSNCLILSGGAENAGVKISGADCRGIATDELSRSENTIALITPETQKSLLSRLIRIAFVDSKNCIEENHYLIML